jgi:hypothetical protein
MTPKQLDALIAWIEGHGATVEHVTRDASGARLLWVRSDMTWAGFPGTFQVTDAIPPTLAAARELLGY